MTLDADPTRVPSGASVLEVSGLFKCCEQDLSRAPLESLSGFTSQIFGIWLFVFRSCAFLTVSGRYPEFRSAVHSARTVSWPLRSVSFRSLRHFSIEPT